MQCEGWSFSLFGSEGGFVIHSWGGKQLQIGGWDFVRMVLGEEAVD